MFRIHEHQIEHFARRQRLDFERRMGDYLKEFYAGSLAGMTDDEIAQWVAAAIRKAVRYGIETEPEVAALMLLMLVLGVDLDETTPWAREVLADRRLLAEGKIKTLIALAREHRIEGIEDVVHGETDEGEIDTKTDEDDA